VRAWQEARDRPRRRFPSRSSRPVTLRNVCATAHEVSAVCGRSIGGPHPPTSKPTSLVTPVEIRPARANTAKTTAAR
jgi:hypothetical protein